MRANDDQLKHGDISFSIIRAFYDVYNELGFGFLEAVYCEAMTLELRSKGHLVDQWKCIFEGCRWVRTERIWSSTTR
jgi:hypothetical protein